MSSHNGSLYAEGYAFDVGSGLKSVQVHTNDGKYINVKPTEYKGLWNWTATLSLNNTSNTVIGLAIDETGNKEYMTRPLNVAYP